MSSSFLIVRLLDGHSLNGVLPRAERQARHLGSNANAALVQQADGILVALADLAEQVLARDLDVVEGDDAGAARADAELLLLLGDGEALGALLDHEGGDAAVALARVDVGEYDEEVGLDRVGDPHLATGDAVAAAVGGLRRARREREGVRPRHGLRQAEAAYGVGGQARQEAALEVGAAPLEHGRVDEGVVDVDEDADGRVDARQLLDPDDGRCEVHAGAAVLLGDLDPHEPLLEQLLHQRRVHLLRLVHVAHPR